MLKELEAAGVQYIDVFQAGNALARVADPHLLGHADLSGADVCKFSLCPESKPSVLYYSLLPRQDSNDSNDSDSIILVTSLCY